MPTTEHERASGAVGLRSPMLEISNAMVRVYKEAYGRGPTKARTHFAGSDTLVVVLENSMTVAERTLAQAGQHQRLRETRLVLQHALEQEFRAIVEQILGRRTLAFAGGIDPNYDVAVHVFTLEPQPSANADGALPAPGPRA